jgi:hypothetical protein
MSVNRPDLDETSSERPHNKRLPHILSGSLSTRQQSDMLVSHNIRQDQGADKGPSSGGALQEDENPNPIFEILVQGENDVPGLLAYALYKQNKRDWLIAFQATNNRIPNSAERAAFILSERIPRRSLTYRRLAEDMLSREETRTGTSGLGTSGPGLFMPAKPANDTDGISPFFPPASKRAQTLRYILGMLVLVVVMAVMFRLAGTWLFGTPGR